ncbi:MAG: hypothetical protein V1773_04175 [bacterium]
MFKVNILIFIVMMFSIFQTVKAQTCGFGCLGLSGFFAGYSIQKNSFDNFNTNLQDKNIKFDNLSGFRFGANLFRANFDRFIVSFKGYYQISGQKKVIQENVGGALSEDKYELDLNHWGIGLDFGIPLFGFLDLKIIEGGVDFFSSSYSYKQTINGFDISDLKFTGSSTDMGYYVGTGLIFHLIKNYASLEGLVYYNKVKVSYMMNNSGEYLFGKKSGLIDSGGFAATIQLNIGVPL